MDERIEIKQYDKSIVKPVDDRQLYDFISISNGIIYGCEVTLKETNILHVESGYGIIKGAKFNIIESDLSVELSSANIERGRLKIRLDLSNVDKPITLAVEKNYTDLVKEENVNETNGIFEISLATFSVTQTGITNLENAKKKATLKEVIIELYDVIYNNVLFKNDMDLSKNQKLKETISNIE